MPAQKARWMGGVRQEGTDVLVTVRDVDDNRRPYGLEYEISVLTLPGTDAYKAAAAVGMNPKEFMQTFKDSHPYAAKGEALAAMVAAIRGTLLQRGMAVWSVTNAKTADRFEPKPEPEPEPKQEEDRYEPRPEPGELTRYEEYRTEPKPEPEPAKDETGDAGDLVSILNRMIRDVAGKTVDEAKVRAIVADAVKDLAPNITRVVLPNMTEVDIEGKQHCQFDRVLRYAALRRHVWMTGPAGTGKTQLAENVAKTLNLRFFSVQCNPQLLASQLIGYMNATGEYVRSLFREAFENGGLFLFDEIDNSHPSTLAMMNAALANGVCAFPDGMVAKHADFVCLAAANTWGMGADDQYIGRQKIDAATLNRFRRVSVGIDEDLEEHVVRSILVDRVQADTWLSKVRTARANVKRHNLRVIVSPRDAIEGAYTIAGGFTMDDAANDSWLAGLNADDLAKVTR